MAIFVPGMRCAISGRVLTSVDDKILFPAFVANEADPLFIFSDAVVHADEFRRHHLAEAAQRRLDEARRRTSPGQRACFVCRKEIATPDQYIGLGHLVEETSDPLFVYNYAHFHRACLLTWTQLPMMVEHLERLDHSDGWKGDSLKHLLSWIKGLAAP